MATAANDLLTDLTQLGIEVVAHGDRLRYRPRSAVTPELAERLREHKPALLAILRPAVAPGAMNLAPTVDDAQPVENAAPWEDSLDPPDPCPKCGSLVFWWNPLGDRRCMACNPPTTAIKAMERAERIRRRHRIPSPAGTVARLTNLRRIIENHS